MTVLANFARIGIVALSIGSLAACQYVGNERSLATTADTKTSYLQVDTQQGAVKGVETDELLIFKGVPYAAPPVGDLRWRAPQPAPQRSTLFDADTFGNRCIQPPENAKSFKPKPEAYTQPQSEDCLYLNIYRPAGTQADLPVMVWVPGGGLTAGSGSRPVNHGGNLAKHGVIVVSINYRLGRLGFFAHPELSAQNPDGGVLYNYGLMDQIAALKWVRDNIAEFGGNPEKVTVFGESAGAASVDALLVSPLAKGLFSGAISQSGYSKRARQERVKALAAAGDAQVEEIGLRIADKLGLQDDSLDALRSAPAVDISKVTDFTQYIIFAVDGVSIVDDSEALYVAGKQADVPLMIGANDWEFGMGKPDVQHKIMLGIFTEEQLAELGPYYDGDLGRDSMLYSDYVFHSQARGIAMAHIKQNNPTYLYRFSVPAVWSTPKVIAGTMVYGAPHAGDMPYVFGNFTGDHGEPTMPDSEQKKVSAQMMQYWTNFAKTGNPNSAELPEWEAFEGNKILHIKLGGPETVDDPWAKRLDKVNEMAGDLIY